MGSPLAARALKTQGVSAMYGVVGIPVAQIASAAMAEGIKYVGMRHEMPATYAAQATSYLTGRLGASLVVSGPGALNAVSAGRCLRMPATKLAAELLRPAGPPGSYVHGRPALSRRLK